MRDRVTDVLACQLEPLERLRFKGLDVALQQHSMEKECIRARQEVKPSSARASLPLQGPAARAGEGASPVAKHVQAMQQLPGPKEILPSQAELVALLLKAALETYHEALAERRACERRPDCKDKQRQYKDEEFAAAIRYVSLGLIWQGDQDAFREIVSESIAQGPSGASVRESLADPKVVQLLERYLRALEAAGTTVSAELLAALSAEPVARPARRPAGSSPSRIWRSSPEG